ncbi:MAG: hypothetical protein SOR72_02070 [Hornefia sp.]|nr:hypothetical protein [Hornefia sp.]
MNKKKLIMLISLAIMVCLIPSTIFAGSVKKYENKKIIKNNKVLSAVLEKFDKKYRESNGEDELSTTKNLVREVISEIWGMIVKDYDTQDPKIKTYSKDVWNEINQINNEINEKIDNAKTRDDLVQMTFLGMLPSDDILRLLNDLGELGKLTVQIVPGGYKDLPTKKSEMNKLINKMFKYKSRPKSVYNEYYWGKYCDARASLKSDVKKITSFRDFVRVSEAISEKKTEDLERITSIEIEGVEIPVEQWIYENKQLNKAKKVILKHSEKTAEKLIAKNKNAKVKTKLAKDALKNFQKSIRNGYDMDLMIKELEKFTSKLDIIFEKGSNPKHLITPGYLAEVKREAETKFLRYMKKDYSDSDWDTIEGIFSDAKDSLDEVEYQEDADDVLKTLFKDLNKIPTKAKALKLQKEKYISEFLKMKKSPKYNNKIHSIVKKAKKAFSNAKTLGQLKALYKIYIKKSDAAIKRYKIEVKKYGAGTVSKSKTVEYGKSYKINVKPKAGHRLLKVVIDGKSKAMKYTYSLKNIKKSHKIAVTFQ